MHHQNQYELIGLMAERDSAIEILAELDAENRELKAKQHVLKIQLRAKDRLIASLLDQIRGLELDLMDEELLNPPAELAGAFSELDLDLKRR